MRFLFDCKISTLFFQMRIFNNIKIKELLFIIVFLICFSFNVFASNISKDLSKFSGISEDEISQAPEDCDKNQLTMNICSLRNSFLAKNKMQSTFYEILNVLPSSCRTPLKNAQKKWEREMETKCMAIADDMGPGTVRPTIINSCREEAMEKRNNDFRRNIKCKSCRECIAIPY
jgi:uncharacterized protein YecT (DUF1311 family)